MRTTSRCWTGNWKPWCAASLTVNCCWITCAILWFLKPILTGWLRKLPVITSFMRCVKQWKQRCWPRKTRSSCSRQRSVPTMRAWSCPAAKKLGWFGIHRARAKASRWCATPASCCSSRKWIIQRWWWLLTATIWMGNCSVPLAQQRSCWSRNRPRRMTVMRCALCSPSGSRAASFLPPCRNLLCWPAKMPTQFWTSGTTS